ncbi:hypothetical protein BV25DRAFT_1991351 [Artomyces pyxidatus]|uniref:Uncharacterized protein n=1 Tax=Artomyces pyxidatus TaxID=48021 RepID=A0ACB8T3L0_9AGAM|nr:hypothetical protein BV25DRAFT_1991351 [Artomyces pyxidatus]
MSITVNGPVAFSLAEPFATCRDISICRTRYTIIWSSLVTILACVWTAVHRNVPGPARAGQSWLRRTVARMLEVGKIVVVTLLVPEWVLAWAVQQFLNAREIRRELEATRAEAQIAWDAKRELLQGMKRGGVEASSRGSGYETETTSTGIERIPTDDKETGETQSDSTVESQEEVTGDRSEWDNDQLAFDESAMAVDDGAGRRNCKWTIQHGFFVAMGGFHCYKNGEPNHPLSPTDVIELVKTGNLVPPTDDEIRGWSQGDALSKILAVVQTLWFVIQCIARRAEGLPITQLEVMTLAYTTVTVTMYAFWWDKPQNVGSPVRVVVKKLPEQVPADELGWYEHAFYAIVGWQDTFRDLRNLPRVPTFYSGDTAKDNGLYADIVALFAAMVFGAVHCAAWDYAFPSRAEELIWRISSVSIVVVPGTMLVPILLLIGVDKLFSDYGILYGGFKLEAIFATLFFFSGPIYVAARILLLALSFTTLRSLPFDAYRAVQWTLLIPHFT